MDITRYFVDSQGRYVGGFDGAGALVRVPPSSVEVPLPPEDARQTWNGTQWSAPPPPVTSLDINGLADALVAKGVLTRAEVDAKKK